MILARICDSLLADPFTFYVMFATKCDLIEIKYHAFYVANEQEKDWYIIELELNFFIAFRFVCAHVRFTNE